MPKLKAAPAVARSRFSRRFAAALAKSPRECVGLWSAASPTGGRSLRPRSGRDLPPRAPAGTDGPVRLHRDGSPGDHDGGRAVRASALSLPAGVLGLSIFCFLLRSEILASAR